MASVSPLSFFSTINVSATCSSSSLFPLSRKPCQPSKHNKPKRHHVSKVACNSNQNNPTTNSEEGNPTHILGNRRYVLIGLGGLCGAATLSSKNNNPLAIAAPLAPDLKNCGLLPTFEAKPRRSKAQSLAQQPLTSRSVELPLTLNSTVSGVVKRPKKSRSKKEKEDEEEVLVIQIQFDRRQAVKFDVLINEEEDEKLATPVNREFAGSFVNVSHTQTQKSMVRDSIFRVGLTDLLEDLEADDDDSVVVTLVPQYGKGLVTVKDIKIEFVAD